MMRKILCIVILAFSCSVVSAQRWNISADSLGVILRNSPSFNVFKDNYFLIGVPTNHTPNKYNSNIKYQISFNQRLTNNILPFNSYLFLTYSQKAFWDIFLESKPFVDLNYNPTFGFATPLFNRNKYKGLFAMMIEHESNGKAGDDSRSWNMISFTFQSRFTRGWTYLAKAWIPFGYRDDNPDLLKYEGCAEMTASWFPLHNDRLIAELTVRKGCTWSWKGNFRANVSYKVSPKSNQYIGFEWFCGHAESLIDYRRFVSMVRVGLVIKPKILMLH